MNRVAHSTSTRHMTEDSANDGGVDELMRRIREEVARQKASIGRGAASSADARQANFADTARAAHSEPIVLRRLPQFEVPLSQKRSYAVAELLQFHDENFVHNAYRALLHREPDASGAAAFLEALRSGRTGKTEILGRMRWSREGRAVGVSVSGLAVPFALRTLRRVPVVGRLLGIIQELLRLPDIVRNQERLEASLFHREGVIKAEINAGQEELESLLTRMHERVELGAVRERLESRLFAVERVVERKAESERLTALGNHLVSLVQRKADDSRIDALARHVDEETGALRGALSQLATDKADTTSVDGVRAEVAALDRRKADLEQVGELLRNAERRYAEAQANVDALRATGVATPQLRSALDDVRRDLTEFRHALLDQQYRVSALLDESRRRMPTPPEERRVELQREQGHLLDVFYASFENRFRGAQEQIKRLFEIYVPIVRDAGAGTAAEPVLDVGCGRGEWLDLLRESGLMASGVDSNRVTIRQCRERGLDVAEGDAIEYLQALRSDSMGAITAMHVVEHLSFERLVALLDEILRVLKSGGLMILETPNPENLLVGACNFWFDPTHQRPLPPSTLEFLAQARGFTAVEIRRLHPYPESELLTEGTPMVQQRINEVLYGAQDYAVVARKS